MTDWIVPADEFFKEVAKAGVGDQIAWGPDASWSYSVARVGDEIPGYELREGMVDFRYANDAGTLYTIVQIHVDLVGTSLRDYLAERAVRKLQETAIEGVS